MGRYALTDDGFIIDKENLFQSDLCTTVLVGDKLIEHYKLSKGELITFTYKIIKESNIKEELYK